jgi:hypothetical protein
MLSHPVITDCSKLLNQTRLRRIRVKLFVSRLSQATALCNSIQPQTPEHDKLNGSEPSTGNLMLIIRAAQIKALDKAAEEVFLEYVAGDIEKRWPEHYSALGESAARERITAAYRRAKGYGIRRKPQVAWFIQLDFVLGEEYERFPGLEWAERILRSDLSPDTKVYRLERRFAKAGISMVKAAGIRVGA